MTDIKGEHVQPAVNQLDVDQMQPENEMADVDTRAPEHAIPVTTDHHKAQLIQDTLKQIGIKARIGAAEKPTDPEDVSLVERLGGGVPTKTYHGPSDESQERSLADYFFPWRWSRSYLSSLKIVRKWAKFRKKEQQAFQQTTIATPIESTPTPISQAVSQPALPQTNALNPVVQALENEAVAATMPPNVTQFPETKPLAA